MNAYQLFKKDPKSQEQVPVDVWVCSRCDRAWGQSRDLADRCCTCAHCGKEMAKIEYGTRTSYHSNCWIEYCNEVRNKQIEKAEKLEAWDGWVCNEGQGGGPQDDGYAQSLDEMVEHLEEQLANGDLIPEDWPEWVFVCDEIKMRSVESSDIIEMLAGEMYEDFQDELDGLDDLQKALDAFNKANEKMHSYGSDHKRVVRVPKPSEEALKAAKEMGKD